MQTAPNHRIFFIIIIMISMLFHCNHNKLLFSHAFRVSDSASSNRWWRKTPRLVGIATTAPMSNSRWPCCAIQYHSNLGSWRLETPSSLHPGKEIFGIPNNRRSVSNIVVLKASSASSSETTSTTTPSSSYNKTLDSEWNIPGLKKEVDRLILRAHKKISKLHLQIQNNNNNESVPNAEPPSIIDKQPELESWQERVRNLNLLQEIMANIQQKQHDVVLPPNIAQLAIDLRVHDRPPPRPERGPGKTKQPNNNDEPNNRSNKDSSAPRKPYRRYYSKDNIEIRVGKKAIDNELVTLDPEHRNNWWMHASGCPGSHVVIRWNIDRGPPPESVVMDAAALAARQSKARNQSNVRVSMTPCRDIRKLPGTPTGTVHLTGAVRTISVNRKDAQTRCDRLDQTVLIN